MRQRDRECVRMRQRDREKNKREEMKEKKVIVNGKKSERENRVGEVCVREKKKAELLRPGQHKDWERISRAHDRTMMAH